VSGPRCRRGRDAGYPAPPAQTRTCGFPASGSSVALASAQAVSVSGHTLLAIPRREVGSSYPARHVRHEFPLRAPCSRRVLPHVVGFPHLRVLRSIRLPTGIQRAFPVTVLLRLPDACSTSQLRFRHSSVSGFPLPCLSSRIPYSDASHAQEPLGPPKFFDVSLPACHGLWTPADLHTLANSGALVLLSVCVKTLSVRNSDVEAVPALQGARHPCGLQDTLSTLRLSCSPPSSDSASDARLDTGGWLALTRQGLSPCKRRQASLGAVTPRIRRGEQRERGTSGRCSQSAPCPCSAQCLISPPLTRYDCTDLKVPRFLA